MFANIVVNRKESLERPPPLPKFEFDDDDNDNESDDDDDNDNENENDQCNGDLEKGPIYDDNDDDKATKVKCCSLQK